MRVLIADDQEMAREAVRGFLTAAGHEVVAATGDPLEALVGTRELKPDTVVLDLGTSTLHGATTLRLLHSLAPGVRIVVHTGFDDADVTGELYRAGSSAVVIKGADPAPLLAAVGG